MANNNLPQGKIDELPAVDIHELIGSLKELHDLGRPTSDNEVADRIDRYFSFCEQSSVRPGIESLCLALHISRTTLFRWSHGEDCSEYRQELVEQAKGFIAAFIEQAMLCGKISPPSGIFLMKNWLSYKDAISIEESVPEKDKKDALSASQLPRLDAITAHTSATLPRFTNDGENE